MNGPYKRVMLKLSGEVFGGGKLGVDPDVVAGLAKQIGIVVQMGVQVAVVVGGGNFFRGAGAAAARDGARSSGLHGHARHSDELPGPARFSGKGRGSNAGADRHHHGTGGGAVTSPPRGAASEKGRVVIFGAGSGMPYFSTDTVAAQRALEISAEVLLMGKQGVDGVYSADPRKHSDAIKFDELTYDEYLARNLKVADATAISMARDYKLPLIFFSLDTDGTIVRVVSGEKIGTIVHA